MTHKLGSTGDRSAPTTKTLIPNNIVTSITNTLRNPYVYAAVIGAFLSAVTVRKGRIQLTPYVNHFLSGFAYTTVRLPVLLPKLGARPILEWFRQVLMYGAGLAQFGAVGFLCGKLIYVCVLYANTLGFIHCICCMLQIMCTLYVPSMLTLFI